MRKDDQRQEKAFSRDFKATLKILTNSSSTPYSDQTKAANVVRSIGSHLSRNIQQWAEYHRV